MDRPGSLRILIVDDHPVVRAGLSMSLRREPGFAICGEAEGVPEAMRKIRETKPDLALVDLDLEPGNGLDLVREAQMSFPGFPILMISVHAEDLYAERALRAGARGYLTKSEPVTRVVAAIREVIGGGVAVSEALKTRVLRRMMATGAKGLEGPLDTLSDRELEVFRELGQGHGTRLIAERLGLSVKTVESHISHIKQKMDIQGGMELQHRAILWATGRQ